MHTYESVLQQFVQISDMARETRKQRVFLFDTYNIKMLSTVFLNYHSSLLIVISHKMFFSISKFKG